MGATWAGWDGLKVVQSQLMKKNNNSRSGQAPQIETRHTQPELNPRAFCWVGRVWVGPELKSGWKDSGRVQIGPC